MLKIVVASKNPVKIESALNGFQKMFPKMQFSAFGYEVVSGVGSQPKSDDETYTGAMNRVNSVHKKEKNADFWVGIEAGVAEKNGEMETFAWVVVSDKTGKFGKSRTATFFLPEKVADFIRGGKELGVADDIVFARQNSKQKNGSVGLLTHDVIVRSSYYEQAVILALISFINKDLY